MQAPINAQSKNKQAVQILRIFVEGRSSDGKKICWGIFQVPTLIAPYFVGYKVLLRLRGAEFETPMPFSKRISHGCVKKATAERDSNISNITSVNLSSLVNLQYL